MNVNRNVNVNMSMSMNMNPVYLHAVHYFSKPCGYQGNFIPAISTYKFPWPVTTIVYSGGYYSKGRSGGLFDFRKDSVPLDSITATFPSAKKKVRTVVLADSCRRNV